MAKIDTTKIANYESMSAEEKVTALEGYDFSDYVSKATLNKATADAAEWKRKYTSTLSEAEQARVEAEAAAKATSDRLAELERKDKIMTAKERFMASGFTSELALATAKAFVEGDMETVLNNTTKNAVAAANAAKDKALHGTPHPPASGKDGAGEVDYLAKSREAMAKGNFAEAAYYQRMHTENSKKIGG